jgi:hypothetical protein
MSSGRHHVLMVVGLALVVLVAGGTLAAVLWQGLAPAANQPDAESQRSNSPPSDSPPSSAGSGPTATDGGIGAGQSPRPTLDGLVRFVSPDDGYELGIRADWAAWNWEVRVDHESVGVRRFGGDLVVSIGQPDGSIYIWPGMERVTVTTLDEIEAAVVSAPPEAPASWGWDPDTHDSLLLGNEPARIERPSPRPDSLCRTCGGAYYHVYAIHAGRPVVLSFDHGIGLPVKAIVASFRFLDGEAQENELRTFTAPDASFDVSLPDLAWGQGSGPDTTALYLTRGEIVHPSSLRPGPTFLSIRMGNANGEVQTCDRQITASVEVCQHATVTSLEELAEAVGFNAGTADLTLDGEPAYRRDWVGIEPGGRGSQSVTYVLAIHGPRPVVLRFWTTSEMGVEGVDEVLSGFRFQDVAELVTYTNAEDGYELLIARSWAEGDHTVTVDARGPVPGVRYFGSGAGFATRGGPALRVTVGQPDGSVNLCYGTCRTVTVSTLAELDGELRFAQANAQILPADVRSDLVLAGEPGRLAHPADGLANSCLGCVGVFRHAYTIRDGRPIVLSFDYWTIAFDAISADDAAAIVDSFRFLD